MIGNIKLVFIVLWNQVASLFFLLLVSSAIVSFFLGEKSDGMIILGIVLVNLALGFFQEFKATKASEKLKNLIKTKVYVLRAGMLVQILSEDLVLDDIVHLVAGSIVPADIDVIETENAFIDDSVRTGESLPKEIRMGDNIFSGSTVTNGRVIGRVSALGKTSSMSKYRSKLESLDKWSSFGKFTEKVVSYIFIASLFSLIVSMVFLVLVMGKFSIAHFLVFAIAMLVGVVPEILPLIITIILTKESLLLAKDKIIVKRLSSLQGLGAIKFLLTDKTGTITENKLRVSAVSDINNFWFSSNAISEGEYERPFMDIAYDDALNSSIGKIKTENRKIVNFEPFKNDVGYEVFILERGVKVIRGQLEKVIALCDDVRHSVRQSALEYEIQGMRVIAIAEGRAGEWKFSGFVAFHDPIKSSAVSSIRIAHTRGIGVKILTGDSKAVAENVARELGLIKYPDNIISLDSVKVSELKDKQLLRAVVFAKCTPENKLELMDRYLKIGPVAFLGDGVNDALALKRADVGIAVDNATDIAKESADIILLEKDLNPILKSVATGRSAMRNVLTYIIYTLSGNAGTFFSLLIASFFYPVLPMLPIQILLNNLLTDLPLMLIITDKSDEYAMRHVPHFEPKKLMKRVVMFGIISSLFDLLYFQLFNDIGVAEFQTGWFLLSVLTELALVLSIRSSRSIFKSPRLSYPLFIGMVISAILPFVFIFNSTLSNMFKFSGLSFRSLSILGIIVMIYILANELAKYFMRNKNLYNKPIVPTKIFYNNAI